MIFCVEDDENIRDLIVYTLENTGFQAQGFEEGKCFRAALGHEKPDLVHGCNAARRGRSLTAEGSSCKQ